MSLNNFRSSVSIVTKFFQTTCHEAGMITRVQLLEGPSPKFSRAKKTSKFRRDFWQLSTLIANISGTQIFTLVTDWPMLPSPSPNGDGGPPKISNREYLKFGLKLSVWVSITSRLVGISSPKLSRRRGELWSTNERGMGTHWHSRNARTL